MWRLLLALPVLLVLVLFALTNTQPVQLGLWPTDLSITVPLSLAVLGAMAVTFFLGALAIWPRILGARGRARRAERDRRLLEAQVSELKAELAPLREAAMARPVPLPSGPLGTNQRALSLN